MKKGMSISLVLTLLGWLIVGCSGPKTMVEERKDDCGCGYALILQEDIDKMVLEYIPARIANEGRSAEGGKRYER